MGRATEPTTFDFLMARYDWLPISGCPGRYTLADGITPLSANELAGTEMNVNEAAFLSARDVVCYCYFEGGGMISYKKANGYLHTLCDEEGMVRKMAMLRAAGER